MRYRWIGTMVTALLALAVAAGAEETKPVGAGDRVRLQGPGIRRSTGSVLRLKAARRWA